MYRIKFFVFFLSVCISILYLLNIFSVMQIRKSHGLLRCSIDERTETKESTQSTIIKVNRNSTLGDDVINITHNHNNSSVTIHLRPFDKRHCSHPQLIGRLSGPVITTLSWRKEIGRQMVNGTEILSTSVLTGQYQVPKAGLYFLEIIVTLCQDMKNEVSGEGFCLQDPDNNRLTSKVAQIVVREKDVAAMNFTKRKLGFWYNSLNVYNHEPLYTRYGPQGCWVPNKTDARSSRCQHALDLTRFSPYQFRVTDKRFSFRDLRNTTGGKKEHICFWGASHARTLASRAKALLTQVEAAKNITVAHIGDGLGKFAEDLVKLPSVVTKSNCTKVIIGTGQWDAGLPRRRGRPTPFAVYEEQLLQGVNTALQTLNTTNIGKGIYFRSTHYNTIKGANAQCPPRDWRNPPVIDAYNDITKRVCEQTGVPFLDSRDIMDPVWDRAKDGSHYVDESSDVEFIFFLNRIFQSKK